jgi:hypothetical protein
MERKVTMPNFETEHSLSENSNTHDIENSELFELELRKQVAKDLKQRLETFRDPKKGIKILASHMGIHEKTLKRLLDSQNKPGYQTVFKIYRVLYDTQHDAEILKRAPEVVCDFLEKAIPKSFDRKISYSLDVDRELTHNPIFSEVYFLAGTGGISAEYVGFHYGHYGQQLFQKMVSQKVLTPLNKSTFVLGPHQASMTPESIKRVGLHLTERFSKPEISDLTGENYQALYAEGLNEEGYNQWLKIELESYEKKQQIAGNPDYQGNIKAFTFVTIDKLTEGKKEVRH